MFGTVIVPLDGSARAEAALPFALDEARRHGAALVLARVIPRPEVPPGQDHRVGPVPHSGDLSADEVAAAERETARYLDGVKRRWGLDGKTATVVAVGDPVRRLLAEAQRHERPLLVLITGGPTDSTQQPTDDVAQRLLRNSAVPVLGVRLPAAVTEPPDLVRTGAGAPVPSP